MSAEVAEDDFLFTIPMLSAELSAGARCAIEMGALSSRQVANTRTRCEHPDGRAENVAEHSFMLAKVAPELAELLYPDLDANLVTSFAVLHDDVEAYVGDTPTDILAKLDPIAKAARESRGLKQLMKDFAHMPRYVRLMQQYEDQQVREAQLVRGVDKLTVLLIHIPNQGKVLRENYTYDSFLQSEEMLLARDAYKYGKFEEIIELRRELAHMLAERFLKK